jgi:hypothetical protein
MLCSQLWPSRHWKVRRFFMRPSVSSVPYDKSRRWLNKIPNWFLFDEFRFDCCVRTGRPLPVVITSPETSDSPFDYLVTWELRSRGGLPINKYKFQLSRVSHIPILNDNLGLHVYGCFGWTLCVLFRMDVMLRRIYVDSSRTLLLQKQPHNFLPFIPAMRAKTFWKNS